MAVQRGKLGTSKTTKKRRSKDPGEIWITSLATTVGKRVIVLGTMIDQLKTGLKKMQSHSGR